MTKGPSVTTGSLQSTELAAGDVRLAALEGGDGPVVLFLHGMDGVAPTRTALDALAAHFHVVAPSHPGFDSSALPKNVDSVDDLAYVYLDLLAGLAGPVAIVGCSLGAWIAAEAAVRSQHGVSALVLSTPVGIKTGGTTSRDILDLYAVPPAAVASAMFHDPAVGAVDFAALTDDDLVTHFRNKEATAMYGWKPYMHNPKLRGRLHRITVPTLVIAGASDGVVVPEIPEAYRAGIAGAELGSINDVGHQPERERPDAFAGAVVRFLDRVNDAMGAEQ